MRGAALLVVAPAFALAACQAGDVAGNTARMGLGAAGGGRASDVVAAGVASLTDVADQTMIVFSPEQEYYLGRAVAANVVAQFGLDPDEKRQAYVRRVGATLVTMAERVRPTFGGYHFAVLATPTVNGLSGPGGYVFLTRGALDACRSEDEVAGLLAHEIAHVSLKHGEAIVRTQAEFQDQARALGRVVGAAARGGEFEHKMSQVFAAAASGLAKTLSNEGYGSALESKADTEGTYVLWASGYEAGALAEYLKRQPGKESWTAHPPSGERAAALGPLVATYGGRGDPAGVEPRRARFAAALGIAPEAKPDAKP